MIGYVAKDKDGAIYLHDCFPDYDEKFGGWFSNPDTLCITNQFEEFDDLKYTDTPVKVEIKLEKL